MTMPLGKSRSSATTVTVSSGSTRTMTPPSRRLGSDVRAAAVVDDHVAEARGHDVGQVGDGRRRFRRRSAVPARFSVEAISSDPSGRKPRPDGAWPVSGSVVMSPVQVDGVHRLAEHVGEPQQALEPSGPLAEAESVGQRRQLSAPLQITP